MDVEYIGSVEQEIDLLSRVRNLYWSMQLECEMSGELLFQKYDLTNIIADARHHLSSEIDAMSDDQLLNTDIAELEAFCVNKYSLELPILGEPHVEQMRTKMTVGSYGQRAVRGDQSSIEVDAEAFTLTVPFTGSDLFFWVRGNQWNSMPPRGRVTSSGVLNEIVTCDPDADRLNQEFDRFINDLNLWLGYLSGDVNGWNAQIGPLLLQLIEVRRARASKAQSAGAGLKFAIKSRGDRAATFSAPIARKTIAPVLPKASSNFVPEPTLTDEAYRDILDTFQQMSEVMERSPHAFASMDEETLRFQFLVPLNARFEGEARGEVFNYGGKTDILITYKGRNIFIAELKVWSGPSAMTSAIDQLLGYLSWRDTKAALVMFNRNKNFTAVLGQIDDIMQAHPNYISSGQKKGETEFRYLFHHPDDAARRITISVLAFDIPAG